MGNSSSSSPSKNNNVGRESLSPFDNYDLRQSFSTKYQPTSTSSSNPNNTQSTTRSYTESKIIPLQVLKDQSCQTNETISSNNKKNNFNI